MRQKAFFLGVYGGKKNKAQSPLETIAQPGRRKMSLTGQSTLEYAIVIFCVVAALLAMQVYLKRAMQGRMRQTADELGQQYAPKNTTGNSTLTYSSNTETIVETLSERQLTDKYGYPVDLDGDGIIENDVFGTETKSEIPDNKPSTTTRTGTEDVGELESSLF